MISATSVPLMMELVQSEHSKEEDIEFFNLEPHADYSGIENIKPLEVIEVEVDGNEDDGMANDTNKKLTAIFSAEQSAMKKKVYLEQNELSVKSTFEYEDLDVIYANEKVSLFSCDVLICSYLSNFPINLHSPHINIQVMALYDHALLPNPANPNKKGVLVLDISCPRVYVAGNLKDKADSIQELYRRQGVDIVVVTFSGRGISVKLPNEEWEDEKYRKSLIGTVLNEIDNKYGLEMPIAIFGYTKMCRGISFRSDKRVPTHMLLSLGRGHNISTIVQSLGRATFNGKTILNDNGFDSVTVLMTSR